jgi:GntR family transcriptional repressor for pyruvate dehydrogenase complex
MLDLHITKQTISDSVSQQLMKLVSAKQLKAGDKLPSQRELAEQLGVGRPSVREALKRLETMGVIRIRHGKSTSIEAIDLNTIMKSIGGVLEIAPLDVLELLEAKEIIESKCSELAADRATKEDLKEMERFLGEMENNRNIPEKHAEADFNFHFTIVKSAGNPFIVEVIKILGTMIEKAIEATAIRDDLVGRDRAMRYHRSLFSAIKARHGKKAVEILHRHSVESRSRYKRAIANLTDEG